MSVEEHSGALAETAARRAERIRFGGREYPWWMVVLALYGASRVATTTLMVTLYAAATLGGWPFPSSRADPTFFTFSGSWDASYYRQIGEHGYPDTIPTDGNGNVQQNPWAFLPLFPWVVRALMFVTGLGFYPAGIIVAGLFGAGATLVLYRLVARRVGAASGLWAAVFFCFGPLSFVLQIAYAESMFFFLMFAGVLMMAVRRYWLVIPFAVAAAFTKPGELALPLALGVVFVARLILERRSGEPFPVRDRVAMIVAGAVSAVAGLAWPLIASIVTGFPNAYVATELSWWTGFVGRVAFVPMTPWFIFTWKYANVIGATLVVAVIGGFVWLLSRRGVRALGLEVVAFAASYGLYIFAVFLPQQSLFRLLMPLAPLAGAPGLTTNRRARMATLLTGIALQPVALLLLWYLGYP